MDNISNILKCFRYLFGKENFNSFGFVKVKVLSKLLREIKFFYESLREEVNEGIEFFKI